MRTFWPTAKSGAPPWTSKQLFISAPYQSGIRCGTKKTKISFGTTVKSRTNSRLAIGRLEVICEFGLSDFNQDERHVVSRRSIAPFGYAIEDTAFHFLERKRRRFLHNFLHALYSQHFAARIEYIRDAVGI